MKMEALLGCALPLLSLLAPAAAAADETTLWVSDDVNKLIYHVTLEGTTLSSFQSGSISEVSLGAGADAGTLWAAKEGSNLIMHFSATGQTLGSFPGTTYDPLAAAPEGVAQDLADGTLWIVDDVTDLVYHVQTTGAPIASWSTLALDALAISPQGIATDPTDDTLWLTDNHANRVYHATKAGVLLASFPNTAFDASATNLQGIGVEGDGSLWLTDRDSHKIYNVTREGALSFSLDASVFGSLNPTGVDVESNGPWTNLGHALPGVKGPPLLVGTGTLLGGAPMSLALTNAKSTAPALLVLGLSALEAPFKSGVLVPHLDALASLTTNGSGAITLSATWPPGLPGGVKLWMQYWISDAAGPAGFAASNGLLATSPL
jgi:DNA-binding beta-propeller fold protein YncE